MGLQVEGVWVIYINMEARIEKDMFESEHKVYD